MSAYYCSISDFGTDGIVVGDGIVDIYVYVLKLHFNVGHLLYNKLVSYSLPAKISAKRMRVPDTSLTGHIKSPCDNLLYGFVLLLSLLRRPACTVHCMPTFKAVLQFPFVRV